jgi:uncharacterized repeat protein (TIGR01451 family)
MYGKVRMQKGNRRMKRAALLLALCAGLVPPIARAATASSIDLQVTLSATTNAVIFGDQFGYSLTVSNASANTATGVVVTDVLPLSWQYIYSQESQGTLGAISNSVAFDLGTLPPWGSATMQIFVQPQVPGIFTNIAVVSADQINSQTNTIAELPIDVFLPTPPLITAQPQSQLLNLGGLLNLVVGVLSPPGTRYQWRLNGANIPGATNSSYTVLSLLSKDAGSYTTVVFNELGATVSQPALISLNGLLTLPASDNFANRLPMLNLLNLVSYSNVGATSEPGEPLHAGVPGGHSVWFTYTPLLSGVVTFSTAGSSFDTLLAVYTGNNLTNLTTVASDDDSGGYYTSLVTFNAVAGTQYSIAVDGAYGAEGNIILNSTFQLLAPPVPQIISQPVDQITSFGGSANFSVLASGAGLTYQWFLDDAPLAGATAPTLQLTNISPSQIGLYRVGVASSGGRIISPPASLQIGIVDGQLNLNSHAHDKFQAVSYAVAGTATKTMLRVSSTGARIHKLSSGTSRGYTGMQVFSTYGSATQSGEPNNCSTPGGSSSWTSLQPPENGIMEIDTAGSNFKTILGVYTGSGTDFSGLVQVACDVATGTGTNDGRVTFAATANSTYYVSVDGVDGAYGSVVLNWNLTVPPSIVSQPNSQAVPPGATVILSASAAGNPLPKCQWFRDGALLSGATNWNMTISNFQASSEGTYQVLASNPGGSAATAPSSLVLDSGLRLDSFVLDPTNGVIQMRLVGVANSNYVIQATSDFVTWLPIATNTPANGLWYFSDLQFASFTHKFYRAVPQ